MYKCSGSLQRFFKGCSGSRRFVSRAAPSYTRRFRNEGLVELGAWSSSFQVHFSPEP